MKGIDERDLPVCTIVHFECVQFGLFENIFLPLFDRIDNELVEIHWTMTRVQHEHNSHWTLSMSEGER